MESRKENYSFGKLPSDASDDVYAVRELLRYAGIKDPDGLLAERLLQIYGNPRSFLCDSVARLSEIEGISEAKAVMLNLMKHIAVRSLYQDEAEDRYELSKAARNAKTSLYKRLEGASREAFAFTLLDAEGNPTCTRVFDALSCSVKSLNISKVIGSSIKHGADTVFFARFHTGHCGVTAADIAHAYEIRKFLKDYSPEFGEYFVFSFDAKDEKPLSFPLVAGGYLK